MLNRAPFNRLPINSAAEYDLKITYDVHLSGSAVQYNASEQSLYGRYGIVYLRFEEVEARGHASLFKSFAADQVGAYGLRIQTYDVDLLGASRWYLNYTGSASGKAVLLRTVNGEIARGAYGISGATYSQVISGNFSVAYESYQATMVGLHELQGYTPQSTVLRGAALQLKTYLNEQRGLSRMANDSLVAYELYIGVDADPDFDAAPDETFTSLPFETDALSVGSTYHFVLRQRNAWDLQSKNVRSWSVTVDDAGGALLAPAAVSEPVISAAADGRALLTGYYDYVADENRADQFVLFITADGSEPDIDNDTPVYVSMTKADGRAKLKYLTLPYGDGFTVKALVMTRRAADDALSPASSVLEVVTSTDGPVAPLGSALFGRVAGQK
jgi:hypothetical protein